MTQTGLEFGILVIVICLLFVIWNFKLELKSIFIRLYWSFWRQEAALNSEL